MLRIMTHLPAIPKFYKTLGDSRFVSVDEDKDVTIGDTQYKGKRALLSAPRWVKLCEHMDQVDSAVERAATLKPTQYKLYLGDNWFLSISEQLPFVDVRRWYQKGTEANLRPTLVGIALTFDQWAQLKETSKNETMKEMFEDVESCWHMSQREREMCPQCKTPPMSPSLVQ